MIKGIYPVLFLMIMFPLCAVGGTDETNTTRQQQQILDRISPSLVQVEYHLQYDKGESPQAMGWRERCPNCGQYHGDSRGEELIREERPYETGGFVLAANQVVVPDSMIHPRFIKNIVVGFGDQKVQAHPVGYPINQKAVILELENPLKDIKPLEFGSSASEDLFSVVYSQMNGQWIRSARPLSKSVTRPEYGREYIAAPSHCVIMDEKGLAVGMSFCEELQVDDSWKGSPKDWPLLSANQLTELLTKLEQRVDGGLLRIRLNFRSPKATPRFMEMQMEMGDKENLTERNVTGIVLDTKTVLILADLKSNMTSRLEKITVFSSTNEAIDAKFKYTLNDYGALVAETDIAMPNPVVISNHSLGEYRNQLLLTANVVIQGEKRLVYYQPQRFLSFNIGWKQHLYPEMAGDARPLFFFDTDGQLLAIPISKRDKVSEQNRFDRPDPLLTSIRYVKESLDNLPKSADASNIPLTEQQENRLAWLGIELQGLNQELARINNVSDLTNDGETGALVSFVYPESPAAQSGIEVGYVLLRLYVEEMSKPIDVKIEEHSFGGELFPWEHLDEIPEQYLDRIPTPWPPVENPFTRSLTDIGFGKKIKVEFFKDGQRIMKSFEVVESPAYYNSAARYKSEPLGMTVRDLTYEVRHYYQKTATDPGIIVSKIERGSKSAVGGIKPYEIITHVNDQPIMTVSDFERLIQNQDELRLSVNRMMRGRVVKINMTSTVSPEKNAVENSVPIGPQQQ